MTVAPGLGCLLVAGPDLLDPNFARTVVLVIAHDAEGSYGLVLNRPLERTLGEVLADADPALATLPLFTGGPVQPGALQFLARAEGPGDAGSGRSVLPGVVAGGALPDLVEVAKAGRGARGYLGYSGWGAGQLEREIAEGSWIIAPARAAHVFELEGAQLWKTVLRELGGRYAWLALEDTEPGSN